MKKEFSLELLKEVLSIQTYSHDQEQMLEYLVNYIFGKENITWQIDNGNLYITKGDSETFPCIVAHMDTVHQITSDLTIIQHNDLLGGYNMLEMNPTGIGGDDKVGVFIALSLLDELDDIKVAFFRDEEVGCEGSYLADMDFFNDCRFVLQADRRGNKDFIVDASGVELSSDRFRKDVKKIVKRYGYAFRSGMMTDVMALKENDIKCSVANVSCGYYRPHTATEYVVISDVKNCLELFHDICVSMTDIYYHEYRKIVYSYIDTFTKQWPYSYPVAASKKRNDFNKIESTKTEKYFGKKDDEIEYCVACWADFKAPNSAYCHTCKKHFDENTLW